MNIIGGNWMPTRLLRELHGFFQLLFIWNPGNGRARAERGDDDQKPLTEVASDRSTKSSEGQPFEVQTYIGSDIAQMQEVERPAKSAELVASVWFGGDDYRTYLLETRKRGVGRGKSGWILWQKGHDDNTGRPLYCRIAFGYPFSDRAAAFVAEQLLAKALEDEMMLHTEADGGAVEAEGLLSAQDIWRIFARVFKWRT
jgi:hypothetical protein